MKAVRFHRTGAPEVLQLDELPQPTPGSGEVLIRVEVAGVNFADTVRRRGEFYPTPTTLPHITGSEVVGTVEAVGSGVDPAMIGRRIFGAGDGGACAQYAVLPVHATFPVPPGIDSVPGVALFIQGLTAALLLKEAAVLKPGESVFIEGAAGGVGSLAVQLAKLYGAGTVIGGAGSEAKRALALELGADHAIDYHHRGWSRKVRELTQGRGVSVVLNMSGGEVFEESFEALAPMGRVMVFGAASGGIPSLKVERLLPQSQGLIAFFLGTYFQYQRDLVISTLNELGGFVRDGKLKVQIAGTWPLAKTAEAHRALESRQTMGKLAILPQS